MEIPQKLLILSTNTISIIENVQNFQIYERTFFCLLINTKAMKNIKNINKYEVYFFIRFVLFLYC